MDGRFHHLNLAPGPHHVEVRAPGYEHLPSDIIIQSHHTMQYLGALAAIDDALVHVPFVFRDTHSSPG